MKEYTCPMCAEKIRANENSSYITCNVCGAISKVDGSPQKDEGPQTIVNNNFSDISVKTSAVLDRGYLSLEDGDFKGADVFFEKVLNYESRNPMAYLGKFLAKEKLKSEKEIVSLSHNIDEDTLFLHAVEFSAPNRASILNGYMEELSVRLENERRENILSCGKNAQLSLWGEDELRRYALQLEKIIPYKDAKKLLGIIIATLNEKAAMRASQLEEERQLQEAKRKQAQEDERLAQIEARYRSAKVKRGSMLFLAISALVVGIIVCSQAPMSKIYKEAMSQYEASNYEQAYELFIKTGEYSRSKYMRERCLKKQFGTLSIGDTVYFGSYPQGSAGGAKTPI